MRLSRINLAIVAIEISKREFIEEYEVLRMLRISKNKFNAICESGDFTEILEKTERITSNTK